MKSVATKHRRFGYHRIHVLDRQGIVINEKMLRRLYREEKLVVGRRGGRVRAARTGAMHVLARANGRWKVDFVFDSFSDGRQFRVLPRANRSGLDESDEIVVMLVISGDDSPEVFEFVIKNRSTSLR